MQRQANQADLLLQLLACSSRDWVINHLINMIYLFNRNEPSRARLTIR